MFLKDNPPETPVPEGCHYLGKLPLGSRIPVTPKEGQQLYQYSYAEGMWKPRFQPRHFDPRYVRPAIHLKSATYAANFDIGDPSQVEKEVPTNIRRHLHLLPEMPTNGEWVYRGTFLDISVSKLSFPGRSQNVVYLILTPDGAFTAVKRDFFTADIILFANSNHHFEWCEADEESTTTFLL